MRSFKHLTPRYMVNRIREMWYQKTCPDHPWLTRQANSILDTYLKNTDHGMEFGSGRSSMWFAKRIANLTSIEHHEGWYKHVTQMFADNGVKNVDYRHFPKVAEDADAAGSGYVKVVDEFESGSLDFALVDGIYRDHVAAAVLSKLRPGGVLIIDNVNHYFPSGSHAPNSRSAQDGPNGEVWKKVHDEIASWRFIWTSSGVSDTAFFFKPL